MQPRKTLDDDEPQFKAPFTEADLRTLDTVVSVLVVLMMIGLIGMAGTVG